MFVPVRIILLPASTQSRQSPLMPMDRYSKFPGKKSSTHCAAESLRPVVLTATCFAAVAVLVFVLLSISALSVSGVLMPVLCGLLCAVVCVYGTSFFTPAVHSRFKRIGDKFKAEHTRKPAKKQ